LAPHETQRLVVSDKTGHHDLRYESETGFCVPIDPGGEMVTPFFLGSYWCPAPESKPLMNIPTKPNPSAFFTNVSFRVPCANDPPERAT